MEKDEGSQAGKTSLSAYEATFLGFYPFILLIDLLDTLWRSQQNREELFLKLTESTITRQEAKC